MLKNEIMFRKKMTQLFKVYVLAIESLPIKAIFLGRDMDNG